MEPNAVSIGPSVRCPQLVLFTDFVHQCPPASAIQPQTHRVVDRNDDTEAALAQHPGLSQHLARLLGSVNIDFLSPSPSCPLSADASGPLLQRLLEHDPALFSYADGQQQQLIHPPQFPGQPEHVPAAQPLAEQQPPDPALANPHHSQPDNVSDAAVSLQPAAADAPEQQQQQLLSPLYAERRRRRKASAADGALLVPPPGGDPAARVSDLLLLIERVLLPLGDEFGTNFRSRRTTGGFEDDQQQQQQQQQEPQLQLMRQGSRASGANLSANGARLTTRASGSLPVLQPSLSLRSSGAEPMMTSSQLVAVSEAVADAGVNGYLHLLPHASLRALLLQLTRQASSGVGVVLPEGAACTADDLAVVTNALDSASTALGVLASAGGTSAELCMSEVIDAAIELIKYHLQHNVLALLDARFRRLYRSGAISSSTVHNVEQKQHEDAVAAGAARSGKGSRTPSKHQSVGHSSAGGGKLPRFVSAVMGRLDRALTALAAALAHVRLESEEALAPLVRAALLCLTVDGLDTVFQVKTNSLLVSVFQHCPGQRQSLLDELVGPVLMGHLASSSGASHKQPRRCLVQQYGGTTIPIQMCVSLVLQLIQSTVELPALDSTVDEAVACCQRPAVWCDRFWSAMLDHLPASRAGQAAKAGTSVADAKGLLENVLQDALAVSHLPDWPAAPLLLHRLVNALRSGPRGLSSPDAAVRSTCVDLLGVLTARLCTEVRLAEDEQPALAAALIDGCSTQARGEEQPTHAAGEAGGSTVDTSDLQHRVLLQYLSHLPANAVRDSARRMLSCRLLMEHLAAVRAAARSGVPDTAATAEAIMYSRRLLTATGPDAMGHLPSLNGTTAIGGPAAGEVPDVDGPTAAMVCRALLKDGVLGRGRAKILMWLIEAGDKGGGGTRKDAGGGTTGGGGGGAASNAAGVRARAVRAVGASISADPRLLVMPEVQAGVTGALQDESVLVREAALELLGHHCSGSPDLTAAYFHVIGAASVDAGITVRKRAVKILWDFCARGRPATASTSASSSSALPLATEAALLILQRAGDTEESMQQLVGRFATELWLLPAPTTGKAAAAATSSHNDGGEWVPPVGGTASQRAGRLAEVCGAWYRAGGSTVRLPLTPEWPIVRVLRSVLELVGRQAAGGEAVLKGAAEVADELLSSILRLQEDDVDNGSAVTTTTTNSLGAQRSHQSASHNPPSADAGGRPQHNRGGQALFDRLLALHALCTANALATCVPPHDPARFVRCLAPYLKTELLAAASSGVPQLQRPATSTAGSAGLAPPEDAVQAAEVDDAKARQRRSAERLLATMAVLEGVLRHLRHLDALLAEDLAQDLKEVVRVHPYVQAVACACACLCALAELKPELGRVHMGGTAQQYYRLLNAHTKGGTTVPVPLQARYLFTLGQLCRYGADLLDRWGTPPAPPSDQGAAPATSTTASGAGGPAAASVPSVAVCMQLFLTFFQDGCNLKVREQALMALGLLFIARPQLMLGVMPLLSSALSPLAPALLKMRCLSNLAEQLRAEEEGLLAKQRDADAAAGGTTAAGTTGGGAAAGLGPSGLARQVGEGDASSASSGIVQHFWGAILLLAKDASTGVAVAATAAVAPPTPASGGGKAAAASANTPGWSSFDTPGGQSTRTGGGPPGSTATADPPPAPAAIAAAAAVRRRALDVVECVLRGGLVAPWTASSSLIALSTDPAPDVAARALTQLKLLTEKHAEFVVQGLSGGLLEAHTLHSQLTSHTRQYDTSNSASSCVPPVLLESVCSLYATVIQPVTCLRTRFLAELIRPLEAATAAQAGGIRVDPGFLAFCVQAAADLPYRKNDEPLAVLSAATAIIERRADSLLAALKAEIHGDATASAAGGAVATDAAATVDIDTEANDQQGSFAAAHTAHDGPADSHQAATAGTRSTAAHETPSKHLEGDDSSANGVAAGTVGGVVTEEQGEERQFAQKAGGRPAGGQLAMLTRSAMAASMLLLLKSFLRDAYDLADANHHHLIIQGGLGASVSSTVAKGRGVAHAKGEGPSANAVRNPKRRFRLPPELGGTQRDSTTSGAIAAARQQYKILKGLLEADASNLSSWPAGQAAAAASAAGDDADAAEEGTAGGTGVTGKSVRGGKSARGKPPAGRTPSTAKPPRGGGSTAASGRLPAGTVTKSVRPTARKTAGQAKKRRRDDSDEEDDDNDRGAGQQQDDSDDNDGNGGGSRKSNRGSEASRPSLQRRSSVPASPGASDSGKPKGSATASRAKRRLDAVLLRDDEL